MAGSEPKYCTSAYRAVLHDLLAAHTQPHTLSQCGFREPPAPAHPPLMRLKLELQEAAKQQEAAAEEHRARKNTIEDAAAHSEECVCACNAEPAVRRLCARFGHDSRLAKLHPRRRMGPPKIITRQPSENRQRSTTSACYSNDSSDDSGSGSDSEEVVTPDKEDRVFCSTMPWECTCTEL